MRARYVQDAVLAGRCAGGEQAAARELFAREHRRVHATLFRVLGHNRDMDDLLQETFIQVFRSLRRYRAEASLSTWIDRIAVRVAYRHLSRKRPQLALEAVPEPAVGPDGARRAVARDGVRRLYAAIEALPPAARIAFALHELDGRSLAQIAEVTGATVTATKVRLWRARRALRATAAADPILASFLEDRE